MPIGLGQTTQTVDGKPVAPLMGSFSGYDGGETLCYFKSLGTL